MPVTVIGNKLQVEVLADESTKTQLNKLQDKVEDLELAVNNLVEITWQELKDLRDNSALVPGRQYRIIDYVTTTVQEGTRSAGHQFDIIVQALDEKTLSENVHACLHEGDTYFANSKLEAWKLKYCLDNDTSRFGWADEVNGKGVIYRMIDEYNNDLPYDFKNIQFKRYDLRGLQLIEGPYYGSHLDSLKNAYQTAMNLSTFHILQISSKPITNVDPETIDEYLEGTGYTSSDGTFASIDDPEFYGDPGLFVLLNDSNYYWVYTFNEQLTDMSTMTIDASLLEVNKISNNFIPFSTSLKDNVFVGNSCYSNTFGDYCGSNTIGSYFYNNAVGNNFYNNAIESNFYDNTIGNDFSGNIIRNHFNNNTIRKKFSDNIIGNHFSSNIIGNDFRSNVIATYVSNNTIGNNFNYNTVKSSFYGNTVGEYFSSNTVGINFSDNIIGNDFRDNIIRNDFKYNIVGNYFSYNAIGSYFYYNTVGNYVQYIQFSVDGNWSNLIRYLQLKDGLVGASSNNRLDLYYEGLRNRGYPTTFELIANGNIVSSWEESPLTRVGKVKATNTTANWSDI